MPNSGQWAGTPGGQYADYYTIDVTDSGDMKVTTTASYGGHVYAYGHMDMTQITDQVIALHDAAGTSLNDSVTYRVNTDVMVYPIALPRTAGTPSIPPPASVGNTELKSGTWAERANNTAPTTISVYPNGSLLWTQTDKVANQTLSFLGTIVVGSAADQSNIILNDLDVARAGKRTVTYTVASNTFSSAYLSMLPTYFYNVSVGGLDLPNEPGSIENTSLRVGKWAGNTIPSVTYIADSHFEHIEVLPDGTINHISSVAYAPDAIISGKFDLSSTTNQDTPLGSFSARYFVHSDTIGIQNPVCPWVGYHYYTRDVTWRALTGTNNALTDGRWVGYFPQQQSTTGSYSAIVLHRGTLTLSVLNPLPSQSPISVLTGTLDKSITKDQTVTIGQYTITYIVAIDTIGVDDTTITTNSKTVYFQRDNTFIPTVSLQEHIQDWVVWFRNSSYFMPSIFVGCFIVLIIIALLIRRARMRQLQDDENADDNADDNDNDAKDDDNAAGIE